MGDNNGIKGFPNNWEEAREWEKKANGGLDYEQYDEEFKTLWKWDCGFKLNYDGSLMRVCSRFFPPTSYYGYNWDGVVNIYLLDKIVSTKKFECETLEDLKQEVETFVNEFKSKLEGFF